MHAMEGRPRRLSFTAGRGDEGMAVVVDGEEEAKTSQRARKGALSSRDPWLLAEATPQQQQRATSS